MDTSTTIILFLAVFAVIAVPVFGMLAAGVWVTRRRRRALARLARGLGLDHHLEGGAYALGHVSGSYHGLQVQITVVTGGSGSQGARTWITTYFPAPLGLGLSVARTRAFGLGNAFGPPSVSIGDPTFDGRFATQGHSAPHVQHWLTPQRRYAILVADDALGGVQIKDSGVAYAFSGIQLALPAFQRVVAAQHQLVQALIFGGQ